MIEALLMLEPSFLDDEKFKWYSLTNVFGANRRHKQAYLDVYRKSNACLRNGLRKDLEAIIIASVEERVSTLVSFSKSVVDQNPWERISSVPTKLQAADDTVGSPSVEVCLFSLVQNFVGHLITNSLTGSEFLEHYPSMLDDLWRFDNGFKYLGMGFPRGFPIPSLTKAHLARQRLKTGFNAFHRALDQVAVGDEPEFPWRDMGDVSAVMKGRSAVWRAHRLSHGVKGACDLDLLWNMNVKTSRTVFWLLVRIWAKPGLIEEVRKEIAPFAQASQAPQQFAVPELPRLKINLEGLVRSCMLLKACYYECLQLDSAPILIRSVRQDFTLTETHPSGLTGENSAKYVLKAGTSVAVPLNAHLKDPRYIDCPSVFKPSRFLVPSRNDDGTRIVDAGTLQPFGGGEAEREIMALVAGILVLWEMEPTNPTGWVIPGHTASTGVAAPSTSIRVRIRRRRLPP